MNYISFDNLPEHVGKIINKLEKIELMLNEAEASQPEPELFSEYVPKSEIRGKFASSATLWNWEKQGKLKSYGIGGKRFYKRSELDNLIKPINQKGGAK